MAEFVEEWSVWRSKGIGSSDAAVILGVSPWKTLFELYEEKAGIHTIDQSNWATRRGTEMEPMARANYEMDTGLECPPKLFVHPEYSFIRASLDGWNEENRVVLEIKCPGKEDHETAKRGVVPEKYYPQIMHQLLASGGSRADYYSFDGTSGVVVSVTPDLEYLKEYLIKAQDFWHMVETRTPPPLSDKDFKTSKDAEFLKAAAEWRLAKIDLDLAAEHEEKMKAKLIEMTNHPLMKAGEVRIQKIHRQGNINYKAVAELKNVDLEKYRGKPSEYWSVKLEKTPTEEATKEG